ncbi:MAG: electron transfer flavoprotein subunit alpha [Cryomorphaceae bacterium BACL7 MAG-120910-bin2]|jgi:electron transfer flavoprotein beta subunit|nr:MAG: electron transfer flavoprotein subunit alpha [Cryomorphaceae bacterium BACL7 MAG-120910-bin2]KRO69003.1 MAG: electron transfer flavoprotein subunit alpha [Cryomorphaceae bacterium BACL7 MAG-120322-bin74]KRO82400.1 MAG: electron transfer flavoprotein subunit alpha [Cryomorphaceae bacterium BACL7 MAG-121220-bin83]NQW25082.1 electron transfer flavoprotein subunit beta/FixA family protein [Cryomorphaceae bacterium]
MKILVCISHVPDTTAKINFTSDSSALDGNGIQFVINPYDEFGLTKALQLKEKHGGTVTVVTYGDTRVEQTLRKALAIGADDAVRLDGIPTDPMQVAGELAAHVQSAGYDLVICGQESIDYNGGIVPGALAAHLDWAFVNACIGLTLEGQQADCLREMDGGKEAVKATLPMVIAGKKGLVEESELRIPNMRGIMTARTKPLIPQPLAGTTPASHPASFTKPAPKAAVQLIDSSNLEELVRRLHEEAKVI